MLQEQLLREQAMLLVSHTHTPHIISTVRKHYFIPPALDASYTVVMLKQDFYIDQDYGNF